MGGIKMKIPKDLYYAENHEWVSVDGDTAVVGISDFAQSELGDVVFVELPDNGDEFDKDEQFIVIESVKTVSDVYMPLTGRIVEVNEDLLDNPELINEDPYGDGWLVEIEFDDEEELNDLMDNEEYEDYVENE